jgi:hypothetical protein
MDFLLEESSAREALPLDVGSRAATTKAVCAFVVMLGKPARGGLHGLLSGRTHVVSAGSLSLNEARPSRSA